MAHVLVGEPVPSPNQVGRLLPEHAPRSAFAPAAEESRDSAVRRRPVAALLTPELTSLIAEKVAALRTEAGLRHDSRRDRRRLLRGRPRLAHHPVQQRSGAPFRPPARGDARPRPVGRASRLARDRARPAVHQNDGEPRDGPLRDRVGDLSGTLDRLPAVSARRRHGRRVPRHDRRASAPRRSATC